MGLSGDLVKEDIGFFRHLGINSIMAKPYTEEEFVSKFVSMIKSNAIIQNKAS